MNVLTIKTAVNIHIICILLTLWVLCRLEHPVKRFKSSQSSFREEMALGAGAAGDLYAGHDHTKMAAMRDSQLDLKHEKLDHNVSLLSFIDNTFIKID